MKNLANSQQTRYILPFMPTRRTDGESVMLYTLTMLCFWAVGIVMGWLAYAGWHQ